MCINVARIADTTRQKKTVAQDAVTHKHLILIIGESGAKLYRGRQNDTFPPVVSRVLGYFSRCPCEFGDYVGSRHGQSRFLFVGGFSLSIAECFSGRPSGLTLLWITTTQHDK